MGGRLVPFRTWSFSRLEITDGLDPTSNLRRRPDILHDLLRALVDHGGLVEGPGVGAAVDGDEDALPLGGADEAHVVPLPVLQEAALVVIGARAFGLKRLAALE